MEDQRGPCLNLCWVVIRMSSLGFWPPMIEACTTIPQVMVHQILMTFHSTGRVVQPYMVAEPTVPVYAAPQPGSYGYPQMTMAPPPPSASFVAPQGAPGQSLNIGPTPHIVAMTQATCGAHPSVTAYSPPTPPEASTTYNPPTTRERPNIPSTSEWPFIRHEPPITPGQSHFPKTSASDSPLSRQLPASNDRPSNNRPPPPVAPQIASSSKAPAAPKPGISPKAPSVARKVWMATGEPGKMKAVECSTIVSLSNILVRLVRCLLAFS
jgi:hypothetical protein